MQLFGTTDVPFKDLPLLEVRLRDAVPEAFDMVLNYVYTDCIDPTKKSKCEGKVCCVADCIYISARSSVKYIHAPLLLKCCLSKEVSRNY